MVTALELYFGLLEEPGVLANAFRHYASDLRLVAEASHRLVEKLADFDFPAGYASARSNSIPDIHPEGSRAGSQGGLARRWDLIPGEPIQSLSAEVATKQNLLSALAGPAILFDARLHGGALPVRLTREDLTRVLVNLVKNSVEAMPEGGAIELGLEEFHGPGSGAPWLVLTVEDTGPGIPASELKVVFTPGYTTHSNFAGALKGTERRTGGRRGLGLAITRSIIEAAGGHIIASNRPHGGARIAIELPVRER